MHGHAILKKGERVIEIFPVLTASISHAKCEHGRVQMASVR